MSKEKPSNPACKYWQWYIDNGKVRVARCTHPDSKTGECEKGKCPKGA